MACSDAASEHAAFCYSMGFAVSPSTFHLLFSEVDEEGALTQDDPWQEGTYATIEDDRRLMVRSEAMRVYHHKQKGKHLEVQAHRGIVLDCQHRSALAHLGSLPLDPLAGSPSPSDAQAAAQMFHTLSQTGCKLRQPRTATGKPLESNPPPHSHDAFNLVVGQVSLGAFQRNRRGPQLKAIVPAGAYRQLLSRDGRQAEAAAPFPDDPDWLYRARMFLSLPHMFAHESISRTVSNDHRVLLEGDVQAHGFRPGPTLSFPRGPAMTPTPLQVYCSVTFPYFFVNDVHHGHTHQLQHARAHSLSNAGQAGGGIAVSCFTGEDLLPVMHAVAAWLSQQTPAAAMEHDGGGPRNRPEGLGVAVNVVPATAGSAVSVLTAAQQGFTPSELDAAARQKLQDCGLYTSIERRMDAFTAWKKSHTSRGVYPIRLQ